MREPIIKIPVARVFCGQCVKGYSAKQISYVFVEGKLGRYKAPHCPHCATEISLERMSIAEEYKKEALIKSVKLFMQSGKDPSQNDLRFITIFYQGGVSGCACIWPKDMPGVERAARFDKYVSKIFGISCYSRDVIPSEYPPTGVPFKYVHINTLKESKRTPIADFGLN